MLLRNDIYNSAFLNEKNDILVSISIKFVPGSPINSESTLHQIMAWCQTGDKPLGEAMITYICVAQARLVKMMIFCKILHFLRCIKI